MSKRLWIGLPHINAVEPSEDELICSKLVFELSQDLAWLTIDKSSV
jgi:hypothetical protein